MRCWSQYNGVVPGHKLTVCVSPACCNNSNSSVGILWVGSSVGLDLVGGWYSVCSANKNAVVGVLLVIPLVLVMVCLHVDQNWAVVTLVLAAATGFGIPPSCGVVRWGEGEHLVCV